jgi:hypothetical protein
LSTENTPTGQVSRRGFLKTSAAAAGGAAVVAAPALAAKALDSGKDAPRVTKPSGPPPAEPVTAYLRNAKTNEVTVMAGTSETTYTDPVLAQRLLQVAGPGATN